MPLQPPTPVAGRITRRTLLKATTATAGALATAVASAEETLAEAAASFVKGVDISWAPQMEARGYSWKNAGGQQTQDLLTILKGYGITDVRLRTFVNPSNDPADGHCGVNEVAAFAKRVEAASMSIMLDYMFGGTWNSVGVQNPPVAWRNMGYSQMRTAMGTYVNQTITVMRNNDVLPTWVQIGNEINSGRRRPVGSVSSPAQLTGLLNAAYDQVKAVSPNSTVYIHLAQPQKYDVMATFFGRFAAAGGKWDMSVFSSYGSADLAAGIVGNMKRISDAYGKPFLQSEFGGRVDRASSTQASLVAYTKALKANGGQGIFYWEPECMSRSPATTWAPGTPPASDPPRS
ncbi:glycosyl hydrolase 53 family protein [Streptomyces coeruleorubidus]|uniref:glycosyl hydrolase 53 family protein n=1 Tax=Streptomyces coeruleorubidus TaxID=116188 RepID=UPI00368DE696